MLWFQHLRTWIESISHVLSFPFALGRLTYLQPLFNQNNRPTIGDTAQLLGTDQLSDTNWRRTVEFLAVSRPSSPRIPTWRSLWQWDSAWMPQYDQFVKASSLEHHNYGRSIGINWISHPQFHRICCISTQKWCIEAGISHKLLASWLAESWRKLNLWNSGCNNRMKLATCIWKWYPRYIPKSLLMIGNYYHGSHHFLWVIIYPIWCLCSNIYH